MQHAGEVDQAMNASGSGSIIREHGIHVQKALKNTRGWVSEAVRHSLYGLNSPNPVGAVTHAGHVKKWLGKAYAGTDMNFDGQVSWMEGGLKTVLSHVKLMKGPAGNP